MLQLIKYWFNVYGSKKELRKIQSSYRPHLKAAKKVPDSAELERCYGEMMAESEPYELDLNHLRTSRMISVANNLDVVTPSMTDDRYWETVFSYRFLTIEGRSFLRKAIREERRARRDAWAPFISLITGLVAAATGLIVAIGGR